MDYIQQYREEVLEDFYKEYQKGRTPNPDILCNQHIKFGSFFDEAMEKSQADYYATGHYVRSRLINGQTQLLRGVDETKDQSYFLYRIPQDALAKTIFPVGGLLKETVRKQAEELDLIVSDKPDSTGICFIGEVDLIDFLSERIPVETGEVVTEDGAVIGEHKGVWFYTYGQRRGFETKVNDPLYVIGKDLEQNRLIVGALERTFSDEMTVQDFTFRLDQSNTFEAGVRIRNLGKIIPSTIKKNGDQARISLTEPIQAVSPGQSAVFYQHDVVVGGGVIADYSYVKGENAG